jgi:hypothetical protein
MGCAASARNKSHPQYFEVAVRDLDRDGGTSADITVDGVQVRIEVPAAATPATVLRVNRPVFRTVLIPPDAAAGDLLQLTPVHMLKPNGTQAIEKTEDGLCHATVQVKNSRGEFVDHPTIGVSVPANLPEGTFSGGLDRFRHANPKTPQAMWTACVQMDRDYSEFRFQGRLNIPRYCVNIPTETCHIYGLFPRSSVGMTMDVDPDLPLSRMVRVPLSTQDIVKVKDAIGVTNEEVTRSHVDESTGVEYMTLGLGSVLYSMDSDLMEFAATNVMMGRPASAIFGGGMRGGLGFGGTGYWGDFCCGEDGDELFGDGFGQSLRDSAFINSGGTSIEDARGGGGEFSGFNNASGVD